MSRDSRHVQLTEKGEVLLNFARRLLGISDEAMTVFHRSSRQWAESTVLINCDWSMSTLVQVNVLKIVINLHKNCGYLWVSLRVFLIAVDFLGIYGYICGYGLEYRFLTDYP